MTALIWDATGQRRYETGLSRGVLYLPDTETGLYDTGYAWNGLTALSESPSGAEATPQWADNRKYLNLVSNEEFGGTIEAFTYPKEFELCDGTRELAPGISISQQNRLTFGLSYQTLVGNDTQGVDYGYKLHLVYGALAAPSEKARATVNDSPEAMTFSWELSTTAVDVPGYRPSAHIVIDSTETDPALLKGLEDLLYGTSAAEPRLPMPNEIIAAINKPPVTAGS